MNLREKARAAFDHLFEIAYWWTSRQSPARIRNGEVGKPGELLQKMNDEDREAIKDLKSDDLAEGKVTEGQVYLAAETGEYYSWQGYTKTLKEEKLAFDRKILRDPPKADRKKY